MKAMRALRSAFDSEQRFVEYVDDVLRHGSYRLLGAFVPG
jgi:hypothetical protein